MASIASSALLVSPTATKMIGNWDILYQSLATDFQKSVANEITVDYHFHLCTLGWLI